MKEGEMKQEKRALNQGTKPSNRILSGLQLFNFRRRAGLRNDQYAKYIPLRGTEISNIYQAMQIETVH